jgi:hypothetical protein
VILILRRIVGYLLIPLFCLLLSACGGSGGDSAVAPPDPATGSNWDQMVWDQGSWS